MRIEAISLIRLGYAHRVCTNGGLEGYTDSLYGVVKRINHGVER